MLNNEHSLISIQLTEEQNALAKDQIYLFASLFDWVPISGRFVPEAQARSPVVYSPSLMRFLVQVGLSLQCPVIKTNSRNTRKRPVWRLKAGFIHSGYYLFIYLFLLSP
jgi:hypothetical protein